MILFTTVVATFFSAVVGGEVSGLARIWLTVILEGENVGTLQMHPEATCFFKFFRATTSMQLGFSHRSPRTFTTTSLASGKVEAQIL